MATIKMHHIQARKVFSTNNGSEIKKGTLIECRVRCYHDEKGKEVSDIIISGVYDGNGNIDNSYPVPDSVVNLNCGNFRFVDTAEIEE